MQYSRRECFCVSKNTLIRDYPLWENLYNNWFHVFLSELFPVVTKAPATVSIGVITSGKRARKNKTSRCELAGSSIKMIVRFRFLIIFSLASRTMSLCYYLSVISLTGAAPTPASTTHPTNMSTTGEPLDFNETSCEFTKQLRLPSELCHHCDRSDYFAVFSTLQMDQILSLELTWPWIWVAAPQTQRVLLRNG